MAADSKAVAEAYVKKTSAAVAAAKKVDDAAAAKLKQAASEAAKTAAAKKAAADKAAAAAAAAIKAAQASTAAKAAKAAADALKKAADARAAVLKQRTYAVKAAIGKEAEHYLVFHGGSGSELHEIHETLTYGVVKMNIDTDTQYTYTRPVVDYFFKNYDKVLKIDGEVGSKKHYDPREWLKAAEKGMTERIAHACDDLLSTGKSLLQ